jgi:CBS domain-containing protein
MKVRDIMTPRVTSTGPNDTIAHAARLMAEEDVGALPIIDGGELLGMVTDRDIAVRAVASDISTKSQVRRIMSEDAITCSPDDSVEDALATMSSEQIRRLPVCESGGKLVGIIALADAAHRDPDKSEVGEALDDICEPAGLHSQAPVFA